MPKLWLPGKQSMEKENEMWIYDLCGVIKEKTKVLSYADEDYEAAYEVFSNLE